MTLPQCWLLSALLACSLGATLLATDPARTTFQISGTPANFRLWTTPAANRIKSTMGAAAVPAATGTRLLVHSAREEFESFKVIVAPTALQSFVFEGFELFAGLPAAASLKCNVAGYSAASPWAQGTFSVEDIMGPDLTAGQSVPLSNSRSTVIWCTVYVPPGACGKRTYTSSMRLRPAGGAVISIPVDLYVFDVLLDISPHLTFVASNVKMPSVETPRFTGEQLEAAHAQYLRHRMGPAGASWPTGFQWTVAWDSTTHKLTGIDPATTPNCGSANGCQFRKYALGRGGAWGTSVEPDWLGTGYASSHACYTAFSRPDPFDGIACNTPAPYSSNPKFRGWMCSEAYETAWGNYLSQMNAFFTAEMGAAEYAAQPKGYWYTQNEPQNSEDYTISAYLCKQAHDRAPGMKVMISREAHPEIYDRQDGLSCGYDIWMAHINRLSVYRTWRRQVENGETSWIYFLDADGNCNDQQCNPRLQPFLSTVGRNGGELVTTNDGMHYRAIPWVLWSMRVSGYYHYQSDLLWDNSLTNAAGGYKPASPRVSATLIREGMEDYEYLWQANCGRNPEVYKSSPAADPIALSIALAMGSWRNGPTAPDELEQLRIEVGKYLEGTRADMPTLVTPKEFPFGQLNFDFRSDPGTNTPYQDGGKTWIPVDVNNGLDVEKGFGWQSRYLGVNDGGGTPQLRCSTGSGGSMQQNTVCFDYGGGSNHFYAFIEPGTYSVTVGVGWAGRAARDGDHEYIELNGFVLRDFACASQPGACVGGREYTTTVTVRSHGPGGALVLVKGKMDVGKFTIISHMTITGISKGTPQSQPTCPRIVAPPCEGGTAAPSTSTTSTTTSTTTRTPTSAAPTNVPTTNRPTLPGATPMPTSAPTSGAPTTAAPTNAPTTNRPTLPGATPLPTSAPTFTANSPNGVAGCELGSRPATATLFSVTLDMPFETFSCDSFFASLAARTALPRTALTLLALRSGSTIVDAACDGISCATALDEWMAAVRDGLVSELPVISATNAAGETFTPPAQDDFPVGAVVGAIVGVLVLVAAVIVAVLLFRKFGGSSSGSTYQPSANPSYASSSPATTTTYVSTAAAAPAPRVPVQSGEFALTAKNTTHADPANSILGMNRGDRVIVSRADWSAATGDWVWGNINGRQGYVPVKLLAQ